jgi:N-acetylneuraminic acid mutarotase
MMDLWQLQDGARERRAPTRRQTISRFVFLAGAMLAFQGCHDDPLTAPRGIAIPAFDLTDAQNGTWATKAPMAMPRFGATVAEAGGLVYVFGGRASGCTTSNTVEAYDPVSNVWSYREPMLVSLSSAAVASAGGLLYVIGGDLACGPKSAVVQAYSPTTNTWDAKAPLPQPRHAAVAGAINGIIYVAGGVVNGSTPSASTVAYDPATNAWTARADMPRVTYGAASGVVNGKLYVLGGNDGAGPYATVQIYNPVHDSWTFGAAMPNGRYLAAGATLDGIIYVIGGADVTSSALNTVRAYDPVADLWASVPPLSVGRAELSAMSSGGVVYAIGGTFPGAALSVNEAFTPATPDVEPPSLTIPLNFTVNATSPNGAVVTFSASATDNSGFATVSCSPTSGTRYAIGITATNCIATDGSGNTASGTFSVTVLGAPQQIANLLEYIKGMAIPEPHRTQLIDGLQTVLTNVRTARYACPAFDSFIKAVRAKTPAYIPPDKSANVIADALRIKAVIGCTT